MSIKSLIRKAGHILMKPVDMYLSKQKLVNDYNQNRDIGLMMKNTGSVSPYLQQRRDDEAMLKRGMQGKKK